MSPLPELTEQDRNWYILKGYEIQEYPHVRYWYLNGKLHREDGPAVEYADGRREWWVNGKYICNSWTEATVFMPQVINTLYYSN